MSLIVFVRRGVLNLETCVTQRAVWRKNIRFRPWEPRMHETRLAIAFAANTVTTSTTRIKWLTTSSVHRCQPPPPPPLAKKGIWTRGKPGCAQITFPWVLVVMPERSSPVFMFFCSPDTHLPIVVIFVCWPDTDRRKRVWSASAQQKNLNNCVTTPRTSGH